MSLYIGLMSGTSMDGLDAVLIDFHQKPKKEPNKHQSTENQRPKYKILARESISYEDSLKSRIHKHNLQETTNLSELAALDRDLALLAAKAVGSLVDNSKSKLADINAIGYAGQTIAHNPAKDGEYGWTTQCGDANILAEETGIKVVADFRRRDIAAQGQGAPLACIFHQEFLSSKDKCRGIINLGGIANITLLQPSQKPDTNPQMKIIGFDIGPANCLLDEWIKKQDFTSAAINAEQNDTEQDAYPADYDFSYDYKGRWAATGQVIEDLLVSLLADSYFSRTLPKTTGRDYFNLSWLENYLEGLDQRYKPEDVQASLVDLVALSISLAIQSQFSDLDDESIKDGKGVELLIAGGGARNDFLMKRIKSLVKFPVMKIDEISEMHEKDLEPAAFAWLAYLRVNEIAATSLPSITGAHSPRILGAIYI